MILALALTVALALALTLNPNPDPNQVAAEAVAATGFGLALVCVSPAAPSAGGSAGAEPLEVTLNGQQYSTFGHAFDYFAPPIAALVAPTGGPTQGGTVIIVSGSDLNPNPNLSPNPNFNPQP